MERTGRAMLAVIAAAIALVALGPGSAAAATIFGTVSDEVSHAGIEGVEVCPGWQDGYLEAQCAFTDANGDYSLGDLPTGQYTLHFTGWRNNLRSVDEFYDDKASSQEANLVTLDTPEEARRIDADLAEGGSIRGNVSDEVTEEPIAEIVACAWKIGGETQRCDLSDSSGDYEINGLPDGEYRVEYEGWNRVNYQREFYEDAEFSDATMVSVVAPMTTPGIDAKLDKGVEILGHVS